MRETIEIGLPDDYWVEAELSEVREVRGHCFMEIVQKDERSNTLIAKASAKCWANRWTLIRPYFERITGQHMCAGLKVLLRVRADFHEAYGFSLVVSDVDATFTLGDMALRRQEIVSQLKAEGVFDMQGQLMIPMFAQRVAVVSSETAAGYGDFCEHLINNDYGLAFAPKLFPAVMQGENVERSVISALDQINAMVDDFDVVVIIRGGGATSDLSGFDTLALAENVANFPIPIITGIGHERDESILDMISCVKVKTPTAAADFLIDRLALVLGRLEAAREKITTGVKRKIDAEKLRVCAIYDKIPMMFSLIKTRQDALMDGLLARANAAIMRTLANKNATMDMLSHAIKPAIEYKMNSERQRLALLSQNLAAVDPELLLSRGYSITLYKGKSVRDPSVLVQGDEIETRVKKGVIKSVVK